MPDRMTPDSPEFRALYPFASHFADMNGYRMQYVDEGGGSEPTERDPVVMVHGNPTWSFFYRKLILGLRDRHRCVVPDHIGMGLSDKPQRYPYILDQHIDNLERLLESVLPAPDAPGGRFTLVVHDWGGPIGTGYAVRHPERIRRLVVLNTSAFSRGTMPERIKLCRVPGAGSVLVRGMNAFAKLATRMTTTHPLPLDVRRAFLMPYNNWESRIAVLRFVQDIPLTNETATYRRFVDTETRLPEALADKPILIQWGMRDWCFTPFFLGLWKEAFPRAEVDEYANAGHYLLEDEGDAILARVRGFLERPLA